MKTPSVILFVILFSASIQAQKQYKYLVFEAAGIKGIAYSGAIEQLEEYGKIEEVTKIGGTSAGAITAIMLSIGYTSEEIYNIMSSTKFQKFNNGGWHVVHSPILQTTLTNERLQKRGFTPAASIYNKLCRV